MSDLVIQLVLGLALLGAGASLLVERRWRRSEQAERTRHAAGLRIAARQTEILLEAGRLCARGLRRDELLAGLVALIQRHVAIDVASITIRQGAVCERVVIWPADLLPVGAASRRRLEDDACVGQALLTGEVVTLTAGGEGGLPPGILAAVALPLSADEGVFGALAVGTWQPGPGYQPGEVAFLATLAIQIAGALWTAELHERLEHRAAELEAALRVRADFMAAMSHELRTPLNAILGFSEVLARRPDRDERQQRYLANIQHSGRTLLELINEVLDFSRLESGRMRLTRLRLDPALAVGDVVAEREADIQARALDVQVASDAHGIEVIGDPQRVRQAVQHLLSNAIKFTPPGGKIEVHVGPSATGDVVRITVTDSGPGVPLAAQAQLFQPFSQLERRGGTGLGLALTRQLVELMGGTVGLDPARGPGASFWLELPSAMYSSVDRGASNQPVILVVDDDPSSVELAALAAAELGCRVVGAATGEAGLTLAHELRPAAVLLDIRLPTIDGYQVLERLRAGSDTAQIPVLMVSVTSERSRSLAGGAFDHLVKPQTPQALRRALGRMLDMRV